MAIPALMSKKIGKPVMMRISRAEEYSLGSARNGFQGRVKLGFDGDGKLLAADMYVVQEGGAHIGFWDFRNARRCAVARLSTRSHALARRARVLQHAHAHGAARTRATTRSPASWSRCSIARRVS